MAENVLKKEETMPRVLIVNSQSVLKSNATGITMRSMWKDFDPSKIIEVYRYKSKETIDDDRIQFRSVQIPPKAKFFNYHLRKCLKLDNYYDRDNKINEIPSQSDSSNVKIRSLKNDVVAIIKALVENEPIRKDKEFLKLIDEFRPEVIYTMGASFFVNSWVLFLAKRYNIPVIVHYMDNWRETLYMNSPLTSWLNKKLARQLSRIESRMHTGLTISEKMADAYHEKYNRNYIAIMNSTNFEPVTQYAHQKLQIVYAGGLHLNRDKSLLEIANELKNRNDVCLIIYTSEKNRQLYEKNFASLNVEFRNAVPHDEITNVYQEADILLHVESFLPENIEFTRYSLSTKIPEYMLSGKPILCFSPAPIAVYEYLDKNNCGLCIDKPDQVIAAIDILNNVEYKKSITENAIRIAKKNHSVEKTKEKLMKVLTA